MKIFYETKTGSVKELIDNLDIDFEVAEINEHTVISQDEDVLLFTYTIGDGEVPQLTQEFVNNNVDKIKFVCSSGSMKFGLNFGNAARVIAKQCEIENAT